VRRATLWLTYTCQKQTTLTKHNIYSQNVASDFLNSAPCWSHGTKSTTQPLTHVTVTVLVSHRQSIPNCGYTFRDLTATHCVGWRFEWHATNNQQSSRGTTDDVCGCVDGPAAVALRDMRRAARWRNWIESKQVPNKLFSVHQIRFSTATLSKPHLQNA
jgi:hypothetical protein